MACGVVARGRERLAELSGSVSPRSSFHLMLGIQDLMLLIEQLLKGLWRQRGGV